MLVTRQRITQQAVISELIQNRTFRPSNSGAFKSSSTLEMKLEHLINLNYGLDFMKGSMAYKVRRELIVPPCMTVTGRVLSQGQTCARM